MNSTFLLLTLARNMRGPFLAQPQRSNFQVLNFDRLTLAKSFSSFCTISQIKGDLALTKSTFSHFLNTVVLVNSLTIQNQTYYNDPHRITCVSTVLIDTCAFLHCISDGDGGALNVSPPQCSIQQFMCKDSTFAECSAMQSGAIVVTAANPIMKSCCFSKCHANLYNHVFAITQTNEKHQASFEQITVMNSPGNKRVSGRNVMYFKDHSYQLSNINSSFNENNDYASILRAVGATRFNIDSSIFSYNTGLDGFSFQQTTLPEITSCIICKNFFEICLLEAPETTVPTTFNIKDSYIFDNIIDPYHSNKPYGHITIWLQHTYLDRDPADIFTVYLHSNIISPKPDLSDMPSYHINISDICNYVSTYKPEASASSHTDSYLVYGLIGGAALLIVIGGTLLFIIYKGQKKNISNWVKANESDTNTVGQPLISNQYGQ